MAVQWWAIACILVSTALAATAAFFLKVGSRETRLELRRFRLAPQVPGAVGLYLLSSVFFVLSLAGAPLSVIIPLTALEYLWVVLLAARFLHERIDAHKITGVVCIVLGVVLVGLGSSTDPGEHISLLTLHSEEAVEARRILESTQESSMNLREVHGITPSTQIQLDVLRKRLKALGYVP